MTHIADHVSGMEISIIKEMAMRAADVPGAVSLAWGLPSFRTPEYIRAAAKAALDEDPEVGRYALPAGLPSLRRRIAERHAAATGVTVDPDANVLVTAGNMQGMNVLFHVLLDAGDEVIVTDPGFASHFQQIRLVGGVPRYWRLDEARGWALDVDALEGLIGERSRAIVLVSPSNPTGRIFGREDLERVGRIARAHGLVVIIDDPYSHFTYDNAARHYNLACDAGLGDNLAYLFSFSKAYAMSGWRLGYMIVPADLRRQALKVHDANIICAPRISQVAGLAAIEAATPPYLEFARELAGRRDLICERLDALPEVFEYQRPEGAYYVFPRIVAAHEDSREFALRLLDQARVSVTPGSGFGPGGEHHVRLAYCVSEDDINAAFDRIARWHAGQGAR
ncbi:MAG: pyridoxal phosphate-dependent aminotransferase [Gammaproteobacteria bacterium]